MSEELTCQVCKKNKALGVASSILGAISFAYCETCLRVGADDLGMFIFTYETCGEDVAPWVKNLMTYHNDKYITWNDFVELVKAGEIKVMTPEELDEVMRQEMLNDQLCEEEQFNFVTHEMATDAGMPEIEGARI